MDPPSYDAAVAAPAPAPHEPSPSPASAALPAPRRTFQDIRKQILINGQLMLQRNNQSLVEVLLAMVPPGTNESSEIANASKHYALLTTPSHKSDNRIHILLRGEPRDTVEEAMIQLLEKLEMMVHDVYVKNFSTPSEGINPHVERWLARVPSGRSRPPMRI
ncbi:Hypothetical protein R9X50_00208000 [Acrodontium crateriforme]|uniref:Uncharacterized protein n=1 Tax=Acrodontium crateriforme TaxID=150365 RepID=A0AAQ3M0A8_9PEZI|nr:Hypothetical protein R9X50_00208000 [Acrodontium crateriforme]